MKYKSIIISFAACLFFFASVPVIAEDEGIPDHDYEFMQLINSARSNPLKTAESMGMDPERILEDLPELKDILTEGLSPLAFNRILYDAAGAHNQDMLLNGYYSSVSLDGRTLYDRVVKKGYLPTAAGESLGMIGFINFIEPGEAVRLVFERMFADELKPGSSGNRNILNPELEEAGISFISGSMIVDGYNYNVYLATCDFGSSPVSAMELRLYELVNEARARPLYMAESLGMDPARVLADLPELADILIQGLPALWPNEKLFNAAAGHTKDMARGQYFTHDSMDGTTFDDRITGAGYEPVLTGEAIGIVSFLDVTYPRDAVELIFRKIFADELDPLSDEPRNILNPYLREMGAGFGAGMFEAEGDTECYILMTCDFGTGAANDTPSHVWESELLELINEARTRPLDTAVALGMDPDQVLAGLPELADILVQGLPPLRPNESLFTAARGHTRDMADNHFFSHNSYLRPPPGSSFRPQAAAYSYEYRIACAGYKGIFAGESLAVEEMREAGYPGEAVEAMFKKMFMDELDPLRQEPRNILNPEFRDAGIGFGIGLLYTGGEPGSVYLATIDFGSGE